MLWVKERNRSRGISSRQPQLIWGLLQFGQGDDSDRAAILVIADRQFPTMSLDDGLAYRQPETQAVVLGRVEGVEQTVSGRGGKTRSVIPPDSEAVERVITRLFSAVFAIASMEFTMRFIRTCWS